MRRHSDSASIPERRALPRAANAADSFVPDLCDGPAVLTIIIIAELLALVLTLGPGHGFDEFWPVLGFTSMFVQWVALLSAGALCLMRRHLARLGPVAGGLAAFALLQAVALAVIGATRWATFHGPLAGLGAAAPIPPPPLWRDVLLCALISAAALRYFYVQHQARRRLEAQNRATVEALQARIRPHFLFNSLNTIAALVGRHSAPAEEAVLDLAELYRATLSGAEDLVPLAEELALCRQYLGIEQLRLGERLRVDWQLEQLPPSARIPPLSLQPLVENAVYYGIEPRAEGGSLLISGERTGERLLLRVRNPLPLQRGRRTGAGTRIALDNVRARLHAHFGDQGRLLVEETPDSYEARIEMPLRVAA